MSIKAETAKADIGAWSVDCRFDLEVVYDNSR
jgi:hypothetical protein